MGNEDSTIITTFLRHHLYYFQILTDLPNSDLTHVLVEQGCMKR